MLKQLISAAAFAVVTLPAMASVVSVTVTGTVYDGYDFTGLFGLGTRTDLTGQTYTMNFSYDTSLGLSHQDATMHEVIGGTVYGVTSPVRYTVEVNGTTLAIAGDNFSFAGIYDTGIDTLAVYQAVDYVYDTALGGFSNAARTSCSGPKDAIERNLDASFIASSVGLNCRSYASFDAKDSLNRYLTNTYIFGTATSFTFLEPVAAVPLPAGLGLISSGLGLLAFLRRRNRPSK